MALMGIITTATTLLCFILVHSAQAKASSVAPKCCTSYTRSPVPFYRITGVATQTFKENCNLDAIIFFTVKKNQICANPRDRWVLIILRKLSDRLKKMAERSALDQRNKGINLTTSTTERYRNITEALTVSTAA
ncbi:hypothetical protein WMY93_001498 [Mugilogobius chulae]|uniref:Chemokine interleukin-8-like domain-containing protein n=1 Tax=Mugilogobius chulae TaxID=88201 RepID=A0AAW0QCF1_9GOBI